MRIFHNVLKEELSIYLLNVNVFDIVSHSYRKGVSKLYASICMVATPITTILLIPGWLMGNMKIRYICH